MEWFVKMRVKILALAVGLLVVLAPAALAQEYGPANGDLGVPAGNYGAGDAIELSGQGFLPDSEVLLALSANATGDSFDLGTAATDSAGALSTSVSIPAGLAPGEYTVSAVGVTPDGATLTLAGAVNVAAPDAPDVTPTTVADAEIPEALPFEGGDDGSSNTGTLVGVGVLALLLVGGFAYWRYRATTR